MIAPDFREAFSINLKDPAKKFIEANHGTELWLALEPAIIEIQQTRDELKNAGSYKCDKEQLEKFQGLFAKNYCNAMLLNKYFSFSSNSASSINVAFTWGDSFSKDRVSAFSPVLEALSSKYNYGVCLGRMACFMPLDGDAIKHACRYMQQAAWIFQSLKENVSQLKPAETSPDFTNEALDMLSNLMLAQAQYLFYKMATEKKQSPELLSKIALQISQYFKKAYEMSQTNKAVKKFDNGRFAGVLEYHDRYFEGSAWLVLGIHRFQKAKDDGRDMGIAAGTCRHANQLFTNMGSILQAIPSDYHANYNAKLKQSGDLGNTAAEKAKTVFFEKIPAFADIKMPDCKNFVKFDNACSADLEKVPTANEVLRHVIPASVRKMQSELQTQLQNQIDQEYKRLEKANLDERSFLGQYQLPQSFYEMTSGADIPDSYMNKIEEFQKKGAISNFKNVLDGLAGLRANCGQMLGDCESTLNEEETFDAQMRAMQGQRWTALPSNGMNGPYKQNITMYRTKVEQAGAQDAASMQRFNDQKSELDILTKTKQDLISMIPVSESANQIASQPPSLALKQALDNVEQGQNKKQDIMRESVEYLANINVIDDLMLVHQGQKTKDEVFSTIKEKFNDYFKRITDQDTLIKTSNEVITGNFPAFQKLKQSIAIDPSRQQFFQRIDLALMCQQDLETMLHQGSEFYQRLVEHLTMLQQNIRDFKMSRYMQVEDLCKQLGVAPPSQQASAFSSGQAAFGAAQPGQAQPGGPPAGGGGMNFDFFQPPQH